MKKFKIVLHLKDVLKPVVLTDDSDDIDNLSDKLKEILKSDMICQLKTENDILIIRPSDIKSILITPSLELQL